MRFHRLLTLSLLGWVLVPLAGADLVHLKSGKILEGQIDTTEGGLLVTGPTGKIIIANALVERFELHQTLAGLTAQKFKETTEDADSLYRLGRWFSRRGLGEAADKAYQKVIEQNADHLLARRALGQVKQGEKWISHHELARQSGLKRVGGRWVVQGPSTPQPILEKAPADARSRLDWAAKRLPVVSREAREAKGVKDRARKNLARRQVTKSLVEVMLRNDVPNNRVEAAKILGDNTELSALPSLVRLAVSDRSAVARKAAVKALNQIDEPHAALYFLKPLESKSSQVRHNAVEALGEMAGEMSTEVLVKTMMSVYGGSPRVYIFVGNQISYIKDYEVELAQSAAVADPEVGYVTDGVVLEFKVYRIVEYHTIRETRLIAKALEKKTGLSLGPNPQKWLAWWRENRGKQKKQQN